LVTLKINDKQFTELLRQAKKASEKSWLKAGEQFKRTTPKDTGNAKRKTKYNKKRINANYDYAGVLDDGLYSTTTSNLPTSKVTKNGYSKQAPKGMSDPSLEKSNNELTTRLRKL
jgi:hypothetical protein